MKKNIVKALHQTTDPHYKADSVHAKMRTWSRQTPGHYEYGQKFSIHHFLIFSGIFFMIPDFFLIPEFCHSEPRPTTLRSYLTY